MKETKILRDQMKRLERRGEKEEEEVGSKTASSKDRYGDVLTTSDVRLRY